jgi:hypothetical protein
MVTVLRDVDPYDFEADARFYVAIKGGSIAAAIVLALDGPYESTRKAAKPVADRQLCRNPDVRSAKQYCGGNLNGPEVQGQADSQALR